MYGLGGGLGIDCERVSLARAKKRLKQCRDQCLDVPSVGGPDTDGGIGTTSNDPYTVKRNSIYLPKVSRQDMKTFSRIRIPQLNCQIPIQRRRY